MTPKSYKVVFFGTPGFAVPVLQALIDHPEIDVVGVVTAPDKISRKNQVEFSLIKKLAAEENIPVFQPEKVRKNEEFLAELIALSLDIIVVAAYGKILPQEVLDLPKHGAINVHPSILPKYRGASPVVGAVVAGDKETGVTIIEMTAEMDAGNIIKMVQGVPIRPSDTAIGLIHKLFEEGANMLSEIIVPYIEGEITPTPQDESAATYVKLLTKEDGQIDWSEPEDLIERKIRAYQPWPGTHTTINGMTIKIIAAGYVPDIDNPVGKISKINKALYIGHLRIDRLQMPGKNPISGFEFTGSYSQFLGLSVI